MMSILYKWIRRDPLAAARKKPNTNAAKTVFYICLELTQRK